MSIQFSVFIATSLDGFIAKKDGSLNWLPGSDGQHIEEDTGYPDFFTSVDTLVMGRNTYELTLSFGEWPYQGKRVIVLSSRYSEAMQPLAAGITGTSSTLAELTAQLEKLSAKHVYVDGGKTIQSFLRAGLINEMTITQVPVLLGEGIPLFGALQQDIKLLHQSTRVFKNGMVQTRYALTGAV